MFNKNLRVKLSRILVAIFIGALIYPVTGGVTTDFFSAASAAPSATANSTTANLWVNQAESTTATANVSATNSTTQWTQINPSSNDDGFSEIISPDQTCASSVSFCKSTSSNWSFSFAGVNYKKVFFGSNFYVTFGGGSSTIPGSISSLSLPGIMLCGADRYVSKQYFMLDASGNLHLRMEGYDFQSSFASTPAIYEITLINGTSTMNVAVGLFTPSPSSARPCKYPTAPTTPTAANTSAGLMYSETPTVSTSSLMQTFPTNANLQYTSTVFTTSNGPNMVSSGGTLMSTNVGLTLIDTITASGGTGATSISMDTPVSGATFDTATGVFRLTRADSVTVTQTFTARDSTGATSSLSVTFVVNSLPTNSQTNSMLTTTLGRARQETMTVAGGTAPFTFMKTSSNSQSGITVETSSARSVVLKVAATGVVAGTTTETITCTDAAGSITRAVFTVVINPAMMLTNSRGYNVPATVGTSMTETITATGGTTPRSFVLSGTLTSGNIFLDTSTASSGFVLLRTLSALSAGTYYETVTATDSMSATVSVGMKLTVTAAAIIGGGATSTFNMNQGTESYDTLTVTGGSTPLAFTVSSSPANAGITISSSSNSQVVVKFATTVLAGTYVVTVTSTDTATATTSHVITATVASPLQWALTNPSSIYATFGTLETQTISVTGGFSGKSFTMALGTNKSNGITLDTSTASSGIVTLRVSAQVAEGKYLVTLTATDSTGRLISTVITLNVVSPIQVLSRSSELATGYSSVRFNGSNQYLTLPGSTKYQLNNTWTLEWWQYETDTATYPTILTIGSGWAVRFSSAGTKLQISNTELATLTPANYKNKWTHFAIVNNGGFSYIYVDGVAMNSNALLTVPNLTSTAAPATATVCIAVSCSNAAGTTFLAGSYFGGMLTNVLFSKRVVYTGTSTTTANFTPSASMTIDSQTVLALIGINGSSQLIDISPNTDTSTAYNSPVGTFEYPKRSGTLPVDIVTTHGFGVSTYLNDLYFQNGYSPITTSWTNNIIGNQFFTTTDFSGTRIVSPGFSSAVTSIDSVTARLAFETITALDANNASISIPVRLTVNPPLAFSATSLNPTTPYLVPRTDTFTVSFGTGSRLITRSNPQNSSINYTLMTDSLTVITVRAGTPVGTYYETITAYDSVGDSETVVVTTTVTPGLTLSAVDSVTAITTTAGISKSLRINAINGSGSKTFTLTHQTTSTTAITLDTSTASSNYVTLNIGTGVAAGLYTERITVTDAIGTSVNLDISVTVNAKPTISYNGATAGAITLTTTAGTTLTSSAFTAALGTGSRTLSLSGLNSGITIDTSTTNIAYVTAGSSLTSTNSTTARTYYETMTVTDSLTATSVRAFSVVVNPAIALTATSVNLTTTAGVSIQDTITATSGTGTGNKTFSITSSPSIAGITNTTNVVNQTTLTIPNTVGAGTYTITVTATDSVGATSSINITLNVNGSAVLSGSNSISMTTGYGFTSGAYIATNGTGSFTFSLSGTLNSSHISIETTTSTSARLKILSSAPSNGSQAAMYYETITAIDSLGGRATLIVTLTVNPVIALSGTQSLNTTFGVSTTNVYQITGGTAPYYVLGKSICAPVQTIDGSYTVLSFVAVGNCTWKAPSGVSAIDYLVVGGGGGGDRGVCSKIWGHGGGGGEVVKSSNFAVTAGSSYSVTVGKGGNGTGACLGTVGTDKGGDGDPSIFNTTTARGGKAAINTTGEGGVSGNGNAGGNPTDAYPAAGYVGAGYPAGGGGGAGGTGSGLNGGIGVSDSISGASIMYGSGGAGKNDTGFGSAYSGGAANALPTPNRGGGGSDLSPFSNSSAGATGVVIVRYLTPTVVSSSQLNIYTDTYLASPGKIVIGVPDSITVGSYVETFTVTDSAATPAVTTYVVTINIAKATPIVSVALPDGGSIATYGSPAGLTSTSSAAGAFTFKKGGTDISGCVSRSTSGGSATCNWTPTDTSTVTISAAFTPTDTTNYNSVSSSNFTLNVNQADTLTVTFGSQNLIFSESGTAVSRAFTLSGLASIDTVTAVSTAITGTANDGTTVNVTGSATNGSPGTSSVSKAGTFSLSGTSVTFSGSTRASYYKAISYVPGTITVNKAGNPITVNYGVSNTVTYKQTGTETATVSYRGSGAKTFSTTSTSYCSLDASSGALTTLQSGSCDVSLFVDESANYLGDTITATVRINKATRVATLTSVANSLKYGETTTVTVALSAEPMDATPSISTGASGGCSVDLATLTITAISGTSTCTLVLTAPETNKYLAASSSPLAITLNKAEAPVLTLTAPANVDYSPTATSATMPSPTFTITGLKLTDTLTAVSGITISYVATGTYPYNSATVPTSANTYALTPTAITLSSGSMGNYNSPTFTSVNWTINKINQETLTVKSLFQEGISVPYDIQYVGGSTAGAVTGEIIAGGSATGCAFSGINLRASSTGTCRIRLKMAANQNYFDIYSDTYTVLIARFVQNTFNFDAPPSGTVIVINSAVPVTKGPDACTSNCQPKVTSVSPTTVFLGDPLTITGVNFTDATEVIFDLDWSVTSFQIDNGGTTITVIVPSDLDVGPGVLNVRSPQGLSPLFQGFTVR